MIAGLYTEILSRGGWVIVWNKGGGSSTIVSCESEGSGAMLHPTLARVSV